MASNTFCEPCNRKETSSVAVSWCNDCEEPLCQECVDAHGVIKVSSTHHVVDLEHALVIQKTIGASQQMCERHSSLTLDLFCTFHDVLCCRGCMTEFHRDCDTLVPIDIASRYIKESALLSDLEAELRSITTSSRKLANLRQDHVEQLANQENEIRQVISKRKRNVIEYVEEQEKRLLMELKNMQVSKQSELDEEKLAMINMEKEATELQRQIQNTLENGSGKQMFLLLHRIKSCISNMDQRLENSSFLIEKPVLQLKDSNNGFTMKEELGHIRFVEDGCSITYNSPKLKYAQVLPDRLVNVTELEFENKFDVNTSPKMQITGMTTTSDGRLLLCNFRNNNILVYESNGTFQSSCPLFGAPWDISVVQDDNSNAVTSMPQRSCVRFINIETLKPGKVIELPGNCYGIACNESKIFVGGIQEFYVLNSSGTHLTTVPVGKTTRLWYINFIGENLLYSDQNAIYCVDLEGREQFTYRSETLARPMGIAVDHRGNIYLAGCNSNNIHRLSSDGSLIDTVLSTTDTIDHPWAMCYDRVGSKFAFANNDGKTICIFKCK